MIYQIWNMKKFCIFAWNNPAIDFCNRADL